MTELTSQTDFQVHQIEGGDLTDLGERIFQYLAGIKRGRGDLLENGRSTRYMFAFVNRSIHDPQDTIFHTAHTFAGLSQEGNLYDDPASLRLYGLHEVKAVTNAEGSRVLNEALEIVKGVKGTLDNAGLGYIDLSNPAQVQLGEVNLETKVLTVATVQIPPWFN